MKSFTNRAARWRGNTTSVTVRLPDPVVEFMDSHVDLVFRNRSEFLQHWATVGMMVSGDPELTEALDWALEQAEPPLPSLLEMPMVEEELPVAVLEEPVAHFPEPAAAGQNGLAEVYEDILTTLRSGVH